MFQPEISQQPRGKYYDSLQYNIFLVLPLEGSTIEHASLVNHAMARENDEWKEYKGREKGIKK